MIGIRMKGSVDGVGEVHVELLELGSVLEQLDESTLPEVDLVE